MGHPIKTYKRYVEDIPPIQKPEVTEHTLHGAWCSRCKKVVFPTLTDALPNAMIGLRLVVFTAWLHYLVGVSVNNIVKILSVVCRFKLSAGGLTQAWMNLAHLLEPDYRRIGESISRSGVLNADETGWRLNGITHWLWCFTTKTLCYYLITRSRGSPVIREVLGSMFRGILICDFWGAYNKITALAKQRCLYHLFTELVKVDKTNPSPTWKAFQKNFPKFEGEMFINAKTRRYIHCIVHPENEYNDQYMKNIFSDMIQIAQETLYQKISKKYNHHNQIFLSNRRNKERTFSYG